MVIFFVGICISIFSPQQVCALGLQTSTQTDQKPSVVHISVCVGTGFFSVCVTYECYYTGAGWPHCFLARMEGGDRDFTLDEFVKYLEDEHKLPSGSIKSFEITESTPIEVDGKKYTIQNGEYPICHDADGSYVEFKYIEG